MKNFCWVEYFCCCCWNRSYLEINEMYKFLCSWFVVLKSAKKLVCVVCFVYVTGYNDHTNFLWILIVIIFKNCVSNKRRSRIYLYIGYWYILRINLDQLCVQWIHLLKLYFVYWIDSRNSIFVSVLRIS